MMLWSDLTFICAHLFTLIRKNQWKGRAEIVFTFDDIGDYAHAEADLARAISEQHLSGRAIDAPVTPFHLNGVQVRIECSQVYKTPSGETISATEALRTGRVQINTLDNPQK